MVVRNGTRACGPRGLTRVRPMESRAQDTFLGSGVTTSTQGRLGEELTGGAWAFNTTPLATGTQTGFEDASRALPPVGSQDHVLWLAESWPLAVRAPPLWGRGDRVAGLQACVVLPCCPPRACLPHCPLPPFTGPPDSPRALWGYRDGRA